MTRSRFFKFTAALSTVGFLVTLIGWGVGATTSPAFRLRPRPLRTNFLWLGPEHVTLFQQAMVPTTLPADYAIDSSKFLEYQLRSAHSAEPYTLTLDPVDSFVRPPRFWFRTLNTPTGGFRFTGESGAIIVQVSTFYRSIDIPYWAPLLLFSIAPAAGWWTRRRARTRHAQNLCMQCGYDLRASPARCPECGYEATS